MAPGAVCVRSCILRLSTPSAARSDLEPHRARLDSSERGRHRLVRWSEGAEGPPTALRRFVLVALLGVVVVRYLVGDVVRWGGGFGGLLRLGHFLGVDHRCGRRSGSGVVT